VCSEVLSDGARRNRSRLILCLAIVYLVWGSTYVAMRVGVQQLPPLLFSGLRFLGGGIVLGAFVWRRGFIAAARHDLRAIGVMSLAGVALSNSLFSWSMQWVPSNEAALLNTSNAFFIALLGTLGPRGEPLQGRSLAGLLLGIAGTTLLLWRTAGVATPLLSQAGIVLGCLSWSLATLYLRNTATRLDIVSFTALQMLVGGAVMIIGGMALGERGQWHWSTAGFASLAYLMVMSACIAYPAYAWLTRHATPAQVGSYAYVNPAVAAVLGWLLLSERLGSLQVLGMTAILAGVVLVNWPGGARPT
jgi:drug/metabolite transporter (DMT)-like permease